MARPRSNPDDPKWASATERDTAPETVRPMQQQMQPRQKRVERQGSRSVPYTRMYPEVRGGVCEYCGVLDPRTPSQYQYKLCNHYRGMELRCSYCPENKDPDAIAYASVLNVHDSPDGQSLIVVCNSYECSAAHNKRFQLNAQ